MVASGRQYSKRAGILLGLGLGGFADGILLHQIFQWHNMGSAVMPPTTMSAMADNMRWDGFFHAAVWVMTLTGVYWLLAAARQGDGLPDARAFTGLLILGWGAFNLVEGIIDHHLLGLHHVRDLPVHVPIFDWLFLGIGGVGFIVLGRILSRRPAAAVALALVLSPAAAGAQSSPNPRVHVSAGGGFLTSGAYFTGPGELELTSGDAFAALVQVSVPVHRSVAVIVAGTHARPEGRITGIPFVGAIGVSGAKLSFADAAVRGLLPLGAPSATTAVAFAQVGAGLAHYSLHTTVVGNRVDEDATNFAGTLGVGIELPLTERFGIELLAKDYIASFRSVRDLEELGIEGRRAHTVMLGVSARVGF